MFHVADHKQRILYPRKREYCQYQIEPPTRAVHIAEEHHVYYVQSHSSQTNCFCESDTQFCWVESVNNVPVPGRTDLKVHTKVCRSVGPKRVFHVQWTIYCFQVFEKE